MGEEALCCKEQFVTLIDVIAMMEQLLKTSKEFEINSRVTKNKFYDVPNEDTEQEKDVVPHRNMVQDIESLINEVGASITRTNNNISDISQLLGSK